MPLVLLTDNGSTEEDEPAYKIASVYDIPFVVIDHHHPDATIDKYLKAHVNPYHVGEILELPPGCSARKLHG